MNPADIRIETLNFGYQPTPNGALTQVRNFAAMEWRPGAETPSWERRELLVDYGGPWNRRSAEFYDGQFRNRNGQQMPTPIRWAYVRNTNDVWPETDGDWVSVSTPAPPDALLQMLIDTLLRNWSWTEVMDAADRSPWKSNEEGAPEQ